MFDFEDGASEREKCFTTVAQLPIFIDPKQIPSKKSPFSAFLNHPLTHTVEIILPETVYTNIQTSLDAKLTRPRYARVFMSPSDILEHEFFNTYIKSGNIIMISEGRLGSDTVFILRDGICKIELGKELYERTGLNGNPIRSGGRKHEKERFVVELNFRLPSMLHGKKGFERIVWAFKNVLNHSLAWLFCDLDPASQDNENRPIRKFQPQLLESSPVQTKLGGILTPSLQEVVSNDMQERECQDQYGALEEWIAMVQLGSPRVSSGDSIDPYLSRYSVPELGGTDTVDLISLKWHGFISSTWTLQLFLSLLTSTSKGSLVEPSTGWFVLSSAALGSQAVEGKNGFTIAVTPVSPDKDSSTAGNKSKSEVSPSNTRHAICWEYVGATSSISTS